MNFTLQAIIEALNTLTIGAIYKYASVGRSSTGACELVSVDSQTGAIQYRRNTEGAITHETRVERITGENVAKLATALNSRSAVEINALYGGSGNFRSALEALVANTANIFVCQIDGKKHIFWDPENSHPVGQITIADAPPVYVPSIGSNSFSPEPTAFPSPAAGNDCRLEAALKVFSEKRAVSQTGGGKTYDECYAEVRAEAARIDGDYLVSCDYDTFRNTLNARQVANSFFSKHTDDDKRRLGDFIAAVRQDPRDISFYLAPGNQPNVPGIGPAMLTAFLTRTRPDLFVFFTEQMFESVKFLGLTAEDALPALSTDSYNTYKGIQTAIRDRMREMGIKAQNGNDADYLTVNEFTWFVSENQDLIKEEVMKKQWKPVNSPAAKKSGTRKLSDAFANDEMLKRLAAALRTKPFAILAGHSGTGKSQLVRRLAYMTCNNELLAKEGEGKTAPGNYCMVQVKPNWHDSSDLLGYYSEMGGRHFVNTPFVQFVCKAYAYPDTPFFVCLDEMNLAPVEQYFAEYLSAIESLEKMGADWVTDPLVEVDKDGETIDPEILGQIMKGAESTEAAAWIQSHGLTIPKNLFVIGTVNMDETTCQFSRKVLDRAMTLLMNTVSFADMATGRKPSEEELLDDDGVKFFLEGDVRGEVGAIESGLLDGINEPLKNTAFVVAYRFANEYALYEAAWAKLNGVDLSTASGEDLNQLAVTALDQVVLMKLLPRIHGEARVVKGLFNGRKMDGKDVPGLKSKFPPGGLSVAMMDKILAREDEYLTFWP